MNACLLSVHHASTATTAHRNVSRNVFRSRARASVNHSNGMNGKNRMIVICSGPAARMICSGCSRNASAAKVAAHSFLMKCRAHKYIATAPAKIASSAVSLPAVMRSVNIMKNIHGSR